MTDRALVPLAAAEVSATLAPDLQKAADLAREEKAQATRRAYGSDFEIFRAWCVSRGVGPLPATAESVASFLACEAEKGIRPSTIGRRVAGSKARTISGGFPAMPVTPGAPGWPRAAPETAVRWLSWEALADGAPGAD